MKRSQIILLAVLGMVSLAGCRNADIVKMSPDTYMITRQDNAGVFGNASRMKAEVIREATEFAESQGMVAIPLASEYIPMAPGRFATFEYQFRVVPKDDPEAQRTSLVPRPDLVIETNQRVEGDLKVEETQVEDRDLYEELIRLNDLKEKGILTEEEFQSLKAELLKGN